MPHVAPKNVEPAEYTAFNPRQEANSMIQKCLQRLKNIERGTNNTLKLEAGAANQNLDSLTKGRIVVRFMSQRAYPKQNRYFQQHKV